MDFLGTVDYSNLFTISDVHGCGGCVMIVACVTHPARYSKHPVRESKSRTTVAGPKEALSRAETKKFQNVNLKGCPAIYYADTVTHFFRKVQRLCVKRNRVVA